MAKNVRAVAALGLPDDTLAAVLAGNAARLYPPSPSPARKSPRESSRKRGETPGPAGNELMPITQAGPS